MFRVQLQQDSIPIFYNNRIAAALCSLGRSYPQRIPTSLATAGVKRCEFADPYTSILSTIWHCLSLSLPQAQERLGAGGWMLIKSEQVRAHPIN